MPMDFEDDSFPASLPTFSSPPQIFETQDMTDNFHDAEDSFFDSPGYPSPMIKPPSLPHAKGRPLMPSLVILRLRA